MGFLEEVPFNPSFEGLALSSWHGLLPDNQNKGPLHPQGAQAKRGGGEIHRIHHRLRGASRHIHQLLIGGRGPPLAILSVAWMF